LQEPGGKAQSVLQINKESRKEGLRYFELWYLKDFAHAGPFVLERLNTLYLSQSAYAIYLNFDTNIFNYTPYMLSEETLNPVLCAKIKNLQLTCINRVITYSSIGTSFPQLRYGEVAQCWKPLITFTFESLGGHLDGYLNIEKYIGKRWKGEILQDSTTEYTTSLKIYNHATTYDTELMPVPCSFQFYPVIQSYTLEGA